MSNLAHPTDLLTADVLVASFLFLDFRDLIAVGRVSQEFRTCAADKSLWKALTYRRFGCRLVEATLHLYHGDYHRMMVDDNRLGALPTLLNLKPSNWLANSSDRHYCCNVPCIKWDRVAKTLLLFFDVTGESDLRHPRTSSIQCMPFERTRFPTLRPSTVRLLHHGQGAINFPAAECDILYEYHESQLRKRIHYQGYLVFPEATFNTPGTYKFCYANRNVWALEMDYEEVPILTIADGENCLSSAAFEREGGVERKIYFSGHEPLMDRKSEESIAADQKVDRNDMQIRWFHPCPAFQVS